MTPLLVPSLLLALLLTPAVLLFTLQILAALVPPRRVPPPAASSAAPSSPPTASPLPTPLPTPLSAPLSVPLPAAPSSCVTPCTPAPAPTSLPARPPLAVLVPAHNEATGIAATLAAISQQLAPGDQLLVVADNCSDDTAAVARAAGATVTVRDEPTRRGKAYALAAGMRALSVAPPAMVLIIDADCLPAPGAFDHLAHRCVALGRPAQACYLMHARAGAAPARLVAEFAWAVKNSVRARGRARLGMACQLSGSGMIFPWDTLWRAPLESGSLVEDLLLGLELAAAGHAAAFCPEALVHSMFADNANGARDQRTRWEHGHLHLLLRDGPRHLLASVRARNWAYFSLVIDMAIPPLSLLVLLAGAASVAPLAGWYLAGAAWPWALALCPPLLLAAALLAAWHQAGRALLPPRRLPHVLLYALAKIPLYLRFLVRRQRSWIGAARDKS